MKKYFIRVLAFLILHTGVNADLYSQLPDVKSTQVNAGSLLTQFTNAIKPASFNDSWGGKKQGWLNTASKIGNASQFAGSISSLAGFLKPGAFKSGFNLQSLTQAASTAKTMADATGLLKNLEGGLKPESMTSGWATKRSGWLSALSLLK